MTCLLPVRADTLLICPLAREGSSAAHVPAACQCAAAGYNPVCADGITWASPCDALCTGRPCYSSGVCQYNAAKATFTPTTGATSAAGGRWSQLERTGQVPACCPSPSVADANLTCCCAGLLPFPCLPPIAGNGFCMTDALVLQALLQQQATQQSPALAVQARTMRTLCTSPFCSTKSSALVPCQPHGGLHGECSRALQSLLSACLC